MGSAGFLREKTFQALRIYFESTVLSVSVRAYCTFVYVRPVSAPNAILKCVFFSVAHVIRKTFSIPLLEALFNHYHS